MKRRFEVEVQTTVIVEIDDEVTSADYEGETILTAHENRERFIEGSTFDTAIGSLAIALGINSRTMGNVDGWADFPREAAWGVVGDSTVTDIYEVTAAPS